MSCNLTLTPTVDKKLPYIVNNLLPGICLLNLDSTFILWLAQTFEHEKDLTVEETEVQRWCNLLNIVELADDKVWTCTWVSWVKSHYSLHYIKRSSVSLECVKLCPTSCQSVSISCYLSHLPCACFIFLSSSLSVPLCSLALLHYLISFFHTLFMRMLPMFQ